ncbi:MAG: tripartite tricarboxylate transporter permease [Nanoarchaeota archaeon]
MVLELIFAILLGVLAGTLTGLIPGIHINLIASILLASLSLPFISHISPIILVIFIVAMSITHTFIDFIPSIYLGAPDEDSFLSILPGHQFMLKGLAHSAFILTLYGSLLALPVIILYTPIFIKFLPFLFTSTKSAMPYILIFLSIYLILREENLATGFISFSLAGFLGLLTFNLPVKEPLLPMLSGLFGLSSLILSLNARNLPRKQILQPLKYIKIEKREFIKSLSASIFIVPFFSFLPGIGSGHASLISSELFNLKEKSFLFLNGAANTIIMGLSFITVYSIGKTRTGSAAATKDILDNITLDNLFLIILAIVIVSIISFILGIYLSKLTAKFINKINYRILTISVIAILILVNLLLSNWLGLLILLTSSVLGIFTVLSRSRRTNLMASLVVPAIVYYLSS